MRTSPLSATVATRNRASLRDETKRALSAICAKITTYQVKQTMSEFPIPRTHESETTFVDVNIVKHSTTEIVLVEETIIRALGLRASRDMQYVYSKTQE